MESPATQNTAEMQDTDMRNMRTGPLTERAALESTLTGAVQLLPSKVITFPPPPSTAAQNLALGQDTVLSSLPGSMAVAGLQEVPLNVNALEPLPTAAQKLGDEHDTDAMPIWVPGTLGAELHVLPSNAKVDESRASTAMQKLTVGHDTESGSPPEEDSRAGRLHVVPSYLAA
jgi:hypothetical protein